MSDIESLRKSFKGDLVTPSDPDYKASIARWASNSERNAKIVAFVKDADDVSAALAYVKSNQIAFAIRAGGHSVSGASSSEGLVIDLSRHVNKVRIDAEKKLAYVGGGALWGSVDKAAIEHGLAAVAGTVSHVGVGGLTLGGGFGWLSGEYGLVIDNVVEVTLTTADGVTRKVNNETHSDLFWGIRGGGCNFGVVTEFVYRLHPQRRTIYGGSLIFAPPALEAISQKTAEWTRAGQKPNEGITQALTRGPTGQPCVIISVFYNGSEEDGRANFKWLFDIGPVADLSKEIPYEELNSLRNTHVPHGVPTFQKGVIQTEANAEVATKALSKLTELTSTRPEFQISLLSEFLPLDTISSVADNATAFRRDRCHNILVIIRWKEYSSETARWAQDACRDLCAIITDGNRISDNGTKVSGYGSYDPEIDLGTGAEIDDKAEVLYGENYPKLQRLKKQYDPDMLFSQWFVIHPAK